jgi:hypothetical protein
LEYFDSISYVVDSEDHDRIFSAVLNKGIHVFHIDFGFVQNIQYPVKAPGPIFYFYGHNIGFAYVKALILKRLHRFCIIIYDQTKYAEIGCVCNGKGPDIYTGFSKNGCNFGQTSRLVFQKDRNLFRPHISPPCFLSLVIGLPPDLCLLFSIFYLLFSFSILCLLFSFFCPLIPAPLTFCPLTPDLCRLASVV